MAKRPPTKEPKAPAKKAATPAAAAEPAAAPEPEVASGTAPAQQPGQPARHPRPQRGASPKGKRRVVIDAQAGRKPPQRRERGSARPEPKKDVEVPTGPIKVNSGITVKELAEALGISPARIITVMMGLGEMVTLTVSLSDDAVELLQRARA